MNLSRLVRLGVMSVGVLAGAPAAGGKIVSEGAIQLLKPRGPQIALAGRMHHQVMSGPGNLKPFAKFARQSAAKLAR